MWIFFWWWGDAVVSGAWGMFLHLGDAVAGLYLWGYF
jgi:hypothetical protein